MLVNLKPVSRRSKHVFRGHDRAPIVVLTILSQPFQILADCGGKADATDPEPYVQACEKTMSVLSDQVSCSNCKISQHSLNIDPHFSGESF